MARGVELLCVLDARGESLCVYRYGTGTAAGRLELVAARAVNFDLLLEDLNGAAPTPGQVRERLKRDGRPIPEAAANATPAISAVVLRVAEDQQVLCLMDTARGGLCVYEFDVKQKRLRLAAARSLKYDFGLQEMNLEGLSPKEVEEAVRKSQGIR